MYKLLLILLLLPMVNGCQSTGTSGPKAASPTTMSATTATPLPGDSATLTVFGMGCPMCAKNIDRQLLHVRGVEKVDVDLGDGAVAVKFAPGAHPDREQIVAAVEASGFTLVDLRQ